MAELRAKFADRNVLWQHIDQFGALHNDWYLGDFMKLDAEIIEKEMKNFESTAVLLKTRIVNLLAKDATKDKVLETHTNNI